MMEQQDNQLNLEDLGVDELEQLIAQLQNQQSQDQQQETTEPQPTTEPQQQQQLTEPVQPQQPVDEPVEPQPAQNIELDQKTLEVLAEMSPQELSQWALQNGANGLAVMQQVIEYRVRQQVMKEMAQQQQRRLEEIAKQWIDKVGLKQGSPQHEEVKAYITGKVVNMGGLDKITENQFREILQSAEKLFGLGGGQKPVNSDDNGLFGVLDRKPTPTDIAGQTPSNLSIDKLDPVSLEQLLDKYEPEELENLI